MVRSVRCGLYTDFCADRKSRAWFAAHFQGIDADIDCRLARRAGNLPRIDAFPSHQIIGGSIMKIVTLGLIAASAVALGACGSTTEQRIGGAAVGAGTGAVVAGPVGAVVGGAAGAITAPGVVRGTRRATR